MNPQPFHISAGSGSQMTHDQNINIPTGSDSALPEIVYKYRRWNDEHQKTILTERVVFMAKPTSFEDKKDCKLFKRYDSISEQDLYNIYLGKSELINPNWTRQRHELFARYWTMNSPTRDIGFIINRQEEAFIDFDNQFGVLSLTVNPRSIDMWNRYSNEGYGFCVGFTPMVMFNYVGGGGLVQYYDVLPDILPSDNYKIEQLTQIFSKERMWAFEEEYRTHKFYATTVSTNDRKIILPPEAYLEVIFGWQMSKSIIAEIMGICNRKQMNIAYKTAVLRNNKIEINAVS